GGPAVRGAQSLRHQPRLGERERRSACAEAQGLGVRGHRRVALERASGAGKRPMPLILGLESSCDETAAALVDGERTILAHRLAGQEAAHRPFGGVVPEIAARAHVEALGPLVEAALADAGKTIADVDAVAATAGPGLIGGVMVGLLMAKGIALAAGKPLVAINHLEG